MLERAHRDLPDQLRSDDRRFDNWWQELTKIRGDEVWLIMISSHQGRQAQSRILQILVFQHRLQHASDHWLKEVIVRLVCICQGITERLDHDATD